MTPVLDKCVQLRPTGDCDTEKSVVEIYVDSGPLELSYNVGGFRFLSSLTVVTAKKRAESAMNE